MRLGQSFSIVLALLLSAPIFAQGTEPEEVQVLNFPEIQSITGNVEMNKPATNTSLDSISETVVAPADPEDTSKLILAGTLEARGFRSAMLSLAGEVKSNYLAEGTVGALLVPNTSFVTRAFQEDGRALLSIRVEAPVLQETGSYFAITEPRLDLAFPSYNVYFFNTTDLPSSVVLYAYLAN